MLSSNPKKKGLTQPTHIYSHSNEYTQRIHYYPFVTKLDRCVRSYNTLSDLSNKVCVPNKTNQTYL